MSALWNLLPRNPRNYSPELSHLDNGTEYMGS